MGEISPKFPSSFTIQLFAIAGDELRFVEEPLLVCKPLRVGCRVLRLIKFSVVSDAVGMIVVVLDPVARVGMIDFSPDEELAYCDGTNVGIELLEADDNTGAETDGDIVDSFPAVGFFVDSIKDTNVGLRGN